MRLLILLALVLVVLVVAWVVVRRSTASRARAAVGDWRLVRLEDGTRSVISLRRGETEHLVGVADRSAEDYDDQLITLHAEAQDLMVRWNAAERSLR